MKVEQKDIKTGKTSIIDIQDPAPETPAKIKARKREEIKTKITQSFADYLLEGIKSNKLKKADLPKSITDLIDEYDAL